jgi:dolichol kinase
MTFLLTTCLLLVGFSFISYLELSDLIKAKVGRKIAHIGAGLYSVSALFFLSQTAYVLQSLLLAFILGATQYYHIFSGIHGQQRQTYGEVALPIGLGFIGLFIFSDKALAILIILIVSISDTAAEICGIFEKRKSLPGSVAFFVSAILICSLWAITLQQPQTELFMLHITIFSFILTVIEAGSLYGSDNVTIPITAIIASLFLL